MNAQPDRSDPVHREPAVASGPASRPAQLLALSAGSPQALDAKAARLESLLSRQPPPDFADVCVAVNGVASTERDRLAVVAPSAEHAVELLRRSREGGGAPSAMRGRAGSEAPEVAFLFTGQGSQFPGMARQLYESQSVFREALDECDAILREHLERPLLSVIYPEAGVAESIHETAYTQPALFSLEYALARMWQAWGIEPAWTIGHSVGEYVAACVAGVFGVEDGLKLIAARGRLMQALPRGGAMVALAVDAETVRPLLPGTEAKVSVAAVNSPTQVVLSGDEETLRSIVAQLDDVRASWLQVSHAFHSPRMDPMLEEFTDICRSADFSPPRLGLISNVTGRLAGPEVQTPEYWARHVREAVLFADGIRALVADGARLLLEVGPKPILTGLGRLCVPDPDLVWLSTLRGRPDDWTPVLRALGELWIRGAPVKLEAVG